MKLVSPAPSAGSQLESDRYQSVSDIWTRMDVDNKPSLKQTDLGVPSEVSDTFTDFYDCLQRDAPEDRALI